MRAWLAARPNDPPDSLAIQPAQCSIPIWSATSSAESTFSTTMTILPTLTAIRRFLETLSVYGNPDLRADLRLVVSALRGL